MNEENQAADVSYFEWPGLFTSIYGFFDTMDLEIRKVLRRKDLGWWKIKRNYHIVGDGFVFSYIKIKKKDRGKMAELFADLDNTLTILYGEKYLKCKKEVNRTIIRGEEDS